MEERKMNELIQKIVDKLRIEHLNSMETHPYFALFGDQVGLLVDWNTHNVDIPDSIRIICMEDDRGYMACIRFDVESTDGTYEPNSANFTYDEAEYDLEGIKGKTELLEIVLEDIFSK